MKSDADIIVVGGAGRIGGGDTCAPIGADRHRH